MANDKKFEVAGNVSIVSTGKTTTVVKEDFEKVVDSVSTFDPGQGQTLVDMYDHYSKLLYVIDASSSMGSGMLSEDWIKRYTWSPELLEQFRVEMRKTYKKELAEYQAEQDVMDEDDIDPDDDGVFEEEAPEDPDALSDDELKMKILSENLSDKHGIGLQNNYNYRGRSRSKMMALKDAAKKFVADRFRKFADARVGVFRFTDSTQLLCASGASEVEVMNAINRLPDGGDGSTEIFQAVERALNDCKKRPSEVGLHHIVFVSDGEDYSGIRVKDLLPRMKELGVIFDFIYMLGATEEASYSETVQVLKAVCEATSGEFVVVKTEQDFEQKFLAVSNRPMLPPAR